jgi:hypothetical protein
MSSSTHDLLQRCSEFSEQMFRRRHGAFQSMIWLVESIDGERQRFETGCEAPDEADDQEALRVLRDEMAADFAHDRIARFAVAYAGRVVTRGLCLLRAPPVSRRLAVAIEAHGIDDVHLRAVRDVAWDADGPYLTAVEKVEATDGGQFGGLLTAVREDREANQDQTTEMQNAN